MKIPELKNTINEMTELKNTINAMTSDDYKERFKAEYYQLKIRTEKLEKFTNKIEAAQRMRYNTSYGYTLFEPKHDCPQDLLDEQLRNMKNYLHCLELRAIIENIEF